MLECLLYCASMEKMVSLRVCACDANILRWLFLVHVAVWTIIAALIVNSIVVLKSEVTNFNLELLFGFGFFFFRNELSLCSMPKNSEKLLILELQRMLR